MNLIDAFQVSQAEPWANSMSTSGKKSRTLKRSVSPHLSIPSNVKKIKPDVDDIGKRTHSSPELPHNLNGSLLPEGVEQIRYDELGPRRGDPDFKDYYSRRVSEKRMFLAQLGKEVVEERRL